MSLAYPLTASRLARTVAPLLLLLLVCLAFALPAIERGQMRFYDDTDEQENHYPTILTFAKQLPTPDIRDYPSATGPLYHVGLAVASRVIGTELRTLRYVNLAIGLCCLAAAYLALRTRHSVAEALVVSFTLLFSLYFLGPAVRLSTDNAALACTILAVCLLTEPKMTTRWFGAIAILMLCAILIRQSSAWLLVALGVEMWQYSRHHQVGRRCWLLFALALAVPAAALGGLVVVWRGFTPPSFGNYTLNTPNLDAPLFVLSLLGVFVLTFSVSLADQWRAMGRRSLVACCAVLGAFILLVVHPMSGVYGVPTPNPRGGALWAAAASMGTLGSTALAFWLLLPIGLAGFYLLFFRMGASTMATTWPVAVCWLLATSLNGRTYQKYYEPFLIFLVAWSMPAPMFRSARSVIAPAVLLALFAALAVRRFLLGL